MSDVGCKRYQTTRREGGDNITTYNTRPKLAYGREGLDWIVRPGYNFGVFSTSRFAPPTLSSVDDPD